MCDKITVRLEIGDNLTNSINKLITAYAHNAGAECGHEPCTAIAYAFGINFTKIINTAIKKSKGASKIEIVIGE